MGNNSNRLSPYVGPKPFQSSESRFFFGREKETRQVVNLILANSVLLLYSQSGLGKTSLINAGIIPRLEETGFEVLPPIRVASLLPTDISDEIQNYFVYNTIMSCTGEQPHPQLYSEIALVDYLNDRSKPLDEIGWPSARVLIFDQFEEVFTQYPGRWEERRDFFAQIRTALEQDHSLRIVLCIREEYLGEMEPHTRLFRDKLQENFRLVGLRREDALTSIQGPLKGTGRSFSMDYLENIVDNLSKIQQPTDTGEYVSMQGEYIEPVLLQVVLKQIWDRVPPEVDIISEVIFPERGIIDHALSNFFSEGLMDITRTTGTDQRTIRNWFEEQLITKHNTRSVVARGSKDTQGLPNAVVDALANTWLIRAESRQGKRWYELVHDRLIQPIKESNKRYYQAADLS